MRKLIKSILSTATIAIMTIITPITAFASESVVTVGVATDYDIDKVVVNIVPFPDGHVNMSKDYWVTFNETTSSFTIDSLIDEMKTDEIERQFINSVGTKLTSSSITIKSTNNYIENSAEQIDNSYRFNYTITPNDGLVVYTVNYDIYNIAKNYDTDVVTGIRILKDQYTNKLVVNTDLSQLNSTATADDKAYMIGGIDDRFVDFYSSKCKNKRNDTFDYENNFSIILETRTKLYNIDTLDTMTSSMTLSDLKDCYKTNITAQSKDYIREMNITDENNKYIDDVIDEKEKSNNRFAFTIFAILMSPAILLIFAVILNEIAFDVKYKDLLNMYRF